MSKDGTSRIYSVESGDPNLQHGQYSIVTDADGKNPRYIDNWDYGTGEFSSANLPGMKKILVGDSAK